MIKKLLPIIIVLILSCILVSFIYKGQVVSLRQPGSPFELSNSTARYALVEAIVDNQTFFLNDNQARFASPDLVFYQGKHMSIFTPGISFMAIPFYVLGKMINQTQQVTYALNSIFLILNIFLVALLAKRFGAKKYPALLVGVIFAFGTNALPYSQTLTQHLVSSAIMIGMLCLIQEKMNLKRYITIGILFSIGVVVDFPNAIMGTPIILYLLSKFYIGKEKILEFNFKVAWLFVAMVPAILLFAYYNFATTGSFVKLAQSIGRTYKFSDTQPIHKQSPTPKPNQKQNKLPALNSILPFNTRDQLNGLYILLISNERSWLFYSPVLLAGIWGLLLSTKKKETKTIGVIAVAVAAIDVVVYSSFGDPWGGWAFGPRYLIPAAAICAAGLGFFITTYRRNMIVVIVVLTLAIYGIWTNSLGTLTTNAIPPKNEALNLLNPIPYTQEYNMIKINSGLNTSDLYAKYFYKFVSPKNYWMVYSAITSVFVISLMALAVFKENKNDKE